MVKIIVKVNDSDQTISRFLKKMMDESSKVNINKMLRTKAIKINNKVVKDPKEVIKENDEICIFNNSYILKEQRDKIYNTNILIQVAYEDDNILVVVKKHNLLVHNTFGDSLDNAVKNYLVKNKKYDIKNSQSFMISHIHRIDKLTKGLVIYAKNKKTLSILLDKVNDSGYIEKTYLLKCEGKINTDFIMSGYIYKDINNEKMRFSKKYLKNAKEAVTHFSVKKNLENETILEAILETGRKNQIRASLESISHPIVNDYKYGGKHINSKKMIYLFACKISFHNFKESLEYLNDKVILMEADI